MKSEEIREQMVQIESAEVPLNLRPTEMDRAKIRAQKQLTLAVLEVAAQLAGVNDILEYINGKLNALRRR